MTKRDYYEILGVPRDVSQQGLKQAYRKLAIQYHPDRNPGDSRAEDRFKEAAEAYSVLSDPDKRARYDRFGHAGLGGQSGVNPADFADFADVVGDFFGFGDFFGRSPGRRANRAHRGADLRYDLQIQFEEAVRGITTKIKIPRQQQCRSCSGSGADPIAGTVACPACAGQGQQRYQQGFFTVSKTCSRCRGSGRIARKPCKECRGHGRIRKEKLLELKIPAGIDDSTKLRVTGEGEDGIQGGPPGDLYVVISVRPHSFFKREGDNLLCDLPITFSQAALGDDVAVPTLEGQERIKVPAGTQSGTIFRLKRRGVNNLNGRGRGDLFVSVQVITPTQLNSEQRSLFRKLSEHSGDEIPEGSLFEKVKEMFA